MIHKIVNAIGPKDAKIAIVGEAPGESEARLGTPFIGAAGRMLNQILKDADIKRSECYITNVCKRRPPNNDLKRAREIGLDIEQSKKDLINELNVIKPNVTVALGNLALDALTGMSYITKFRGSILKAKNGLKVIPTIHPAAIMRNIVDRPLSTADFTKAKYESEFADFRSLPKRVYDIEPSYTRVMTKLDEISRADFVSLDIETDKGAGIIKCIGLAPSDSYCLVVPLFTNKPYWSLEEEISIWKMIKIILQKPDCYKIIQNEHFERAVLHKWVGEIKPVFMDTMIGHHLCYPELKKSLALQTSLYTNEPFYKDEARDSGYESKSLWRYNAKDCCVTYEIAMLLQKQIEELNLHDFMHGYQMPLSRLMYKASHHGILIDQDRVMQLRNEEQSKLEKYQQQLNDKVGRTINVNSPKQIATLLYEDMKMPSRVSRKTGRVSTDEKALGRLAKLYPNIIFDLILDIRRSSKLISTYFQRTWDADGRLRPSWIITGTETGRLSSRKNIRGTGMNMQNQPKKAGNFRDIFISDPGCSFVVVDLSQVEARLVAYLAKDYQMMKVFENNEDIHSMVASWVYNKPIEMVGSGTIERVNAKALVHGANYSIGVNTFSEHAGIPKGDAQMLLDKYYASFNIGKWHSEIRDKLQKDRILTTPFGRRRQFYGWWGDDLFRQSYAYIPQSTASDHINMAALRIDVKLPDKGIILMQVHDEIVVQCLDKDVSKVKDIITNELSVPIIINNTKVNIPIDISHGKNWRDLDK